MPAVPVKGSGPRGRQRKPAPEGPEVGSLVDDEADAAAFDAGDHEELGDLRHAARAAFEREGGNEAEDGGRALKKGLRCAAFRDGGGAAPGFHLKKPGDLLLQDALGADGTAVGGNAALRGFHSGEAGADGEEHAYGEETDEGYGDENLDERHAGLGRTSHLSGGMGVSGEVSCWPATGKRSNRESCSGLTMAPR